VKRGGILRPGQEEYLDGVLPPRDALIAEVEQRGLREEVPISDPATASLLAILVRACGARRILEVGTAIGYGVLWMAKAAPEAHITTIDVDPGRIAVARAYAERAGVSERVEFVEGPALEVLGRLSGPFDLAYIDAVKAEYRRYLDLLLPLLRVGGLVVADNVLWSGEVAEPPEEGESAESRAMGTFNAYLMMHPQLQSVILPLGDGVAVAAKTRPLRIEMGGPF
jgi:caffeoyl-CoA O-methyltransferase